MCIRDRCSFKKAPKHIHIDCLRDPKQELTKIARRINELVRTVSYTHLEEVCIAAAGRVLKTVTTHVEYEYAQESVVTGEDVHTLNLLGIEKAQEALKEVNDKMCIRDRYIL